ncbi:hypothetical protein B0H66DRAFT_599816 [Apodospora peruviana]|uniref:Uncharacterized protein n=1 Tax=Apodospora peruviana TaxID=516989 RepID=A0AAE0IIN7_9PEZI|nr:hypothetical protein B0H66DRAFT_599816 [Apodospora peruviana]
MKNSAILAYMTAFASAQVTINPDGTYTCEKPNLAFCAGDSMKTDIIIRCYGTRGQPGRCGDNLSGEPPVGNTPALCYQTSDTAGDAACEKNCVVYGGSGNAAGEFTLPPSLCTPTFTPSSSAASSTSSSSGYPVSSSSESSSSSSTTTTTTTPVCTTTTVSVISSSSVYTAPTSSPVISVSTPVYPTNGTTVVISTTYTSGTATPVKPSSSSSSSTTTTVPTAGAALHHGGAAGGALALAGFVAAYIL